MAISAFGTSCSSLRALLLCGILLGGLHQVAAQDVIPSSVDARLIQGTTSEELLIQVRSNSTAPFGGIFSALTVTIRYDAASGAALGAGTSFCSAWSAFTPSPVVTSNGVAYRTYNGFGINRLEDPVFDGGCGGGIPPNVWFTITTIPVSGGACTDFTLGNDAFTQAENRNFYLSMAGVDITGQVLGATVQGGNCALDCLGVPGGTALPGTPCDDGDAQTVGDAWTVDCECIGTPACTPPSITATSSDSPICAGSELNLGVTASGTAPMAYAWTGTGTFSPSAAAQQVSVAGAATGNYQVTVTNACGTANANIAVVVNAAPTATIAYGGSPYCSSGGTANVTRTGTSGGSYSATPAGLSINASTGAINLGSSAAGSYTVTYSIAASGGCAAFSTTASVVVSTAPAATIAYSGSPYCSSGTATVTRTGSAGGSYSATPAGLSINASTGAINLGSSAAGSYTVTYSIAASGGCSAFSTTAPVVVSAAPSATIAYGGSPYCSSGGTATVTRTGSTGGSYSATPAGLSINASTGAINLGSSAAGTYTVTYSIGASGGCAAFSTTAPVVVNTAPSATIAYGGSPYCSSGTATVTRTGSTGGSYSAAPAGLSINASTGAITLGSSAAGSYTVTYSIGASGGCAAFSTTAPVVVSAAPSATIAYGGSPYCSSGGTANVTRTGTSGGSYSATPAGLSINASTGAITLGSSAAGSYTVTYSIGASGGCAAFSTTAPVVVSAAPSATIAYGGSPYCSSGGTANVTRTGTSGGSYSATPAGLSINASTGAITLGTSAAGSYTVTYSIGAAGGCAAFSTTAPVVVSAAPSATIAYGGSPYCSSGGTANVTRTGTSGGSYSATPAGLSINASTGAITLGSSAAGTYTVTYSIAAAGGCAAFSTTAPVVVSAAPSATIAYGGSPYCSSGGTANVTRTGTSGGSYSATPAGLSINASTGAITLGTSATGTYTVTYSIAAAGGCAAFSTTAAVVVSTAPSATIAYEDAPYCVTGGAAVATRTGDAGGVFSALPVGLSMDPNSGAIDLGASVPGNYTVSYALGASGGCAAFVTSTTISIAQAPQASIAYPASPYCASGGTASVNLTGSLGGLFMASPAGLAIDANSGEVDLDASTVGSYTVTYTVPASNGCAALAVTAPIEVSAAPAAAITYDGSPYCATSGTATVTRTGSSGGSYSAEPAGLALNASTGAIDLGASAAGTYTITYAIAAAGGCSAFSTTTVLAIDAAPSATISYAGSPYCSSQGQALATRTGTPGGVFSAAPAGLSILAGNGAIDLGGSTAGTYTVTYAIAAGGGCEAFSTSTQVVIDPAPAATIVYPGSPYCSDQGPAVVERTGTPGGTFSASPAGLAIDPATGTADLESAAAGSYVVTYSIAAAGGCGAFSTTANLVVGAAPDATIAYAGSPYCLGTGSATVTRTGTPGGTFSATPGGLSIDAATGAIDLGTSTAGTYTVTYAIAAAGGCAAFATTAEVLLGHAPSASIVYSGSPYCSIDGTATVTRTGSAGGSYSAVPAGLSIDATTGAINIAASTPGMYAVTYAIAPAGGCGSFSTSAAVNIEQATTWYADLDGDGAGDPLDSVEACEQPLGYVSVPGDDCPDDPAKTDPGTCGCGIPDMDTDGDGIADCIDSCPELPGQIGDACDDGDPSTTNDVVTADCACAGTVVYDCPVLEANIGDACDDGDPATTNDVVTADCACAGTLVYDCPVLEANIGDACDDGDPATTNDVVTADCACAGTVVYDCPVLEANIGDACDDGDPATTNDVVTADCACAGTLVYDCPVLEANIGDACDDGDPATTNDVVTADCACAGTVVYDCPVLEANIGDACDDGDPATTNDVVTADCACVGTLVYDCPVLEANIGDACDDGDPSTTNDVVTAACACAGTVVYDCPVLEANIGDACDDGDPETENDVITADCACAGTLVYDCPVLEANIGDACDDGDPSTTNDVITAACACMGTVPCDAPVIEAISSNAPICAGSLLTLHVSASGTGPLSYAWTGIGEFEPSAFLPEVNVQLAQSGVYEVSVSNGCGSATSSIAVVVNPAPDASISYAGTPYCTEGGTAEVSLAGSGGGTYAAQPTGLEIDAVSGLINLEASQAGTYTVTYAIAASGGCAAFSTFTELVVQQAVVWYADVDGDGAGDDAAQVIACEQPAGYVAVGGDLCPTDPEKVDPGACGCGIPDTDTDGDGTPDCLDGCPTDPDKIVPGACGCGIPDTDTDGDGIADCIDSCPELPGQIGDACDDGDPATENDVVTADCACVGTVVYDCPVLEANIGDACDDGDPATENDVITADCACMGTLVYDCPVLEANIGDACDDGDPETENDVITADCACMGTVVYDCPVLEANIGDACDDGNPATIDDAITEDCICEGSIINGIGANGQGGAVLVALYPNPSRTGDVILHIEGLHTGRRDALIVVSDAAGKRIYEHSAQVSGGVLHHAMELSDRASSGLYLVEAFTAQGRYTQRLVIQ